MLCDEERDASLAQTVGILLHHVIAHDLNITAVGFQEEVAHDMCLRRHGDAVMRIRMLGKISLQHLHVFVSGSVERQVENLDFHLWEVVVHVVAETYLSVVLLLADHLSVLGLSHQHDLLFATGNHHQHLG